jgi:hypothetical protein
MLLGPLFAPTPPNIWRGHVFSTENEKKHFSNLRTRTHCQWGQSAKKARTYQISNTLLNNVGQPQQHTKTIIDIFMLHTFIVEFFLFGFEHKN